MKDPRGEEARICAAFNQISSAPAGEVEFILPKEIGSGYWRRVRCNDFAEVILYDYQFNRDLTMSMERLSHKKVYDMVFHFGDPMEWHVKGINKLFGISANESYLQKRSRLYSSSSFSSGQRICGVQVSINEEKFKDILKNLDGFEHEQHGFHLKKHEISPQSKVILQQMMQCPYRGHMKYLYIEGKVLELMVVYMSEIAGVAKAYKKVRLSPADVNRLHMVKAMIDGNIVNPLTIAELSRSVYLNELKLKNGFKAVFGKTVYAYLMDRRMEMAQALFQEKKMSVTEAAHQVGYSNSSHFAEAFRKKFGINPGEYLRKLT